MQVIETFLQICPVSLKLNITSSKAAKEKISIDDCTKILKTFSEIKSPGTDGLSIEFYRHFWNKINKILIDCCGH